MAINKFRRDFSGKSVYTCNVCKRQTRNTGDNGSCDLCPQCFELAGIENTFSDYGADSTEAQQYVAEALQHIAALDKKGIDTDTVWGDLKALLKAGPANDRHGEQ